MSREPLVHKKPMRTECHGQRTQVRENGHGTHTECASGNMCSASDQGDGVMSQPTARLFTGTPPITAHRILGCDEEAGLTRLLAVSRPTGDLACPQPTVAGVWSPATGNAADARTAN